MNIESFLNRIWYNRLSIWAVLLWPLSLMFALLANLNKQLYRCNIKSSIQLPVPVIVVGNITVGGTGKTPLTVYLAQELTKLGWNIGIVSRGYARTGIDKNSPQAVTPHSNPAEVGDEPLLLARATGVPVFVARQRAVAGQALLAAHPSVNIILCDDGLQHYALARDLELCVIDGARGQGNGLRLPAGPLREPRSRLRSVNALVFNGKLTCFPLCKRGIEEDFAQQAASPSPQAAQKSPLAPLLQRGECDRDLSAASLLPPQFVMQLQAQACYQLTHPDMQRSAADFAGEILTAMPGIGNPARFFATLRDLNFRFTEQAMPDHHAFSMHDLPASGAIIVTEKDAVKLSALNLGADGDRIWVLPVAAQIEPNLADWLDEQLRKI